MKGWILTNPEMEREIGLSPEMMMAVGVEMVWIDDVSEIIISNEIDGTIVVKGERVPLPDYVLFAVMDDDLYRSTTILRQLESLGVLCINSSRSISISSDKIYSAQILAAAGLPIAKSLYCDKRKVKIEYIESQFAYPTIVKIIDGTKGKGVVLVKNREELVACLEDAETPINIIIQEYIADSVGFDIRVVTFNGEVLNLIGRRNSSGDFRSNIALGGKEEIVELNDKIRDLAKRCYEATGINFCGLDLLVKGDGYVICEMNSVPGGMTAGGAVDAPRRMFAAIMKMVSEAALPAWKVRKYLNETAQTPYIAEVKGEDTLGRYKITSTMSGYCQRVQQNTLSSIIASANRSTFGKEHNFETIADVESFQRSLPVSSWSDIEPYAKMMERGEENVLFNGKAKSFVVTTGTTGKPKYIPESELGAKAKAFVTEMKLAALVKHIPQIVQRGTLMPIVSNGSDGMEEKTVGGIPCAYASASALGGIPALIRNRISFPLEIVKINDTALATYLIMRYSIACRDLLAVAGNNAIRFVRMIELAQEHSQMIVDDICNGTISYPVGDDHDAAIVAELRKSLTPNPERGAELQQIIDSAQPFMPSSYWSEFSVASFWLSASVGVFVKQLRPMLSEKVKFIDTGYGASELKINIPIELDAEDGLLSTTTAFYEFLPLDNPESQPLLAHELEQGEEYELIVTTYSGLYRYNMNDVVKCSGFVGTTPKVVFMRKSSEVSNIHGEKLHGSVVVECMAKVAAKYGAEISILQVFPDSESNKHVVYVESSVQHTSMEQDLDDTIRAEAWAYNMFRESNMLNPLSLVFMKRGWQQSLYQERMVGGVTNESQIKIQVVRREQANKDWYQGEE